MIGRLRYMQLERITSKHNTMVLTTRDVGIGKVNTRVFLSSLSTCCAEPAFALSFLKLCTPTTSIWLLRYPSDATLDEPEGLLCGLFSGK